MEFLEIKNRWNEAVLYSGEHTDVREAVESAVEDGTDLSGANLGGTDLSGAHLNGANLSGAYLNGANLSGTDLGDANLNGAHLNGADLNGAYLARANLACANLTCANLSGAYLTCADLGGARLVGAKVGAGAGEATLFGSRPIVQIGPIGSRDDWLLVFWCGDSGMRISTGCQNQITEHHFLERLAEAHGDGEQANIHAQHYIEALAFAKRLLKDHL